MIACFVGGTFFGLYLQKQQTVTVKTEGNKEVQEDGRAADIARQWHNILTYDGTERGQIGDDWDA